jgi:hypothetical protein
VNRMESKIADSRWSVVDGHLCKHGDTAVDAKMNANLSSSRP